MTTRTTGICCLCLLIASVASGQAREWPSERPPRSLPARAINFPPYQVQTLPNGLQVVAVLHHEQPAVSMRMLVGAGSASDPKGKLGLAHLVSSLLDQGTTTRSAKQMNDDIDSIGGAMGAGAARDLSFVNMVVMKDSFERGMRMLAEMVEHPGFANEELDRQRQQSLSFLKVSLEDPEFVANAVFDRLVYGLNPYGMPDSGTPATMASITRNDLVSFHEKFFVPNNAVLAIVGDVTAEEAFETVKKGVRRLEIARGGSRSPGRAPELDAPRDYRRQSTPSGTEIRVGNIGIPRNHQDYMALNLAIRILGRGQQSAVPGPSDRARPDLRRAGGSHDAERKRRYRRRDETTRSDATGEVLRLIVDQMWRLQRGASRERARGRKRHDRELSADDRNAGLDCPPGAERDLLRPAARTAADLPRTGQSRHRR